MDSQDPQITTPWYKQFWPWFLITIPCCSMVLSMTMYHLAASTEDSLVIDDYYKEGKAINLALSKIRKAKELGIVGNVQIEDGSLALEVMAKNDLSGAALSLQFSHATLQRKDFSLTLTRDAHGKYRARVPSDIDGKWTITLYPHDNSWRVKQKVVLPQSDGITLIP